jgi:3-hydroxyacyl-CoA dehydrogenase
MAAATQRRGKVIGLHFHNPAPVMQVVELVRTILTTEETIESVKKWGATLGKTVVVAPDVGGFIVTRLFTPFLLGAIRMLEAGIATRDEIDTSMKLAVNHPMGPLEVIDFIGLDTELSIAETLYEEKEKEALIECGKLIAKLQLPMKLLSAEYDLDASRLTFLFSAAERVDFRELVRELTKHFKIRVQLQQ